MTATGDCFPVAFRLQAENPDWRLCHGTVVRESDGVHHTHAWVEYTHVENVPYLDGSGTLAVIVWMAVDRANGNDVILPADYYRQLGGAHDVLEYDRDEACTMAVRTGHYGPWSTATL